VTVDVPLATPVTVNTVPVADTVTAAGLLLLTSYTGTSFTNFGDPPPMMNRWGSAPEDITTEAGAEVNRGACPPTVTATLTGAPTESRTDTTELPGTLPVMVKMLPAALAVTVERLPLSAK
jgi:hypothetical protein